MALDTIVPLATVGLRVLPHWPLLFVLHQNLLSPPLLLPSLPLSQPGVCGVLTPWVYATLRQDPTLCPKLPHTFHRASVAAAELKG